MAATLVRIARQLPLAILSPLFVLLALPALWLTDVCWKLFGTRRTPQDTLPDTTAASVVIPNWNGKHLLEKYLPSVVTAMNGHPRNEVIVVDNGSTDGSADFLRDFFPTVRCIALPRNLGFGGGSNTGFREATNDIVVLLNSDMRVDAGFLQPLLDGFTNEKVFAVSCQIFFSDPHKRREETGLTQAWWSQGALRVRHYDDPNIDRPFPCFYGGGGSCAFDRRKFLELGGFDHVMKPFYLEDTDLGFMAWKRGWQVLYQPHSKVWHEHQGTIGKKFSRNYIESVVAKNFLLFAWKNIHEPARLANHFLYAWSGALLSLLAGESRERASLSGLGRALLQLPGAMATRWRARSLAVVGDSEALRRPMGGYFRDRFQEVQTNPERLNVLFLSPYSICPPIHGGGVFMYEAVKQLGQISNLHVLALIDDPKERQAHASIVPYTKSVEFVVRLEGQPKGIGALTPFAVREFFDREVEWLLHRQIFLREIDVVQVEYTNMGQYAGPYNRIVWALFEHDVYFQSIGRTMKSFSPSGRVKAFMEYLRAMRYELQLLPRMDEIQTCTQENTNYLLSFLPQLKDRIHHHLRAGIDTSGYEFSPRPRRPKTMLFMGSFRHLPNQAALRWFLREVMPHVLEQEPEARLMVIGSDPPAAHTVPAFNGAVQLVGFVENIRQPLAEYAVFICPILSGSGVRVKLLEAFAAGIPTVSTRIGAEGLGEEDGLHCALADDPREFAAKIIQLFQDPEGAAAMAERARQFVSEHRDIGRMTQALEATYRSVLAAKQQR
ncbi:glycosyltransferase [uncultured Paludibaculum sp.]|uniref:glycosyltransferase n=1 Tax=uncultured Paludibaculum sp. TaxID=1765020 RepID=UPI002AAAD969|nr:glycosyltransferase [uncultured Paludibaculum sp.]